MSTTTRKAFFGAFFLGADLLSTINAFHTLGRRAEVKYSTSELLESYDYVVVGGGTSGLTVANRLSEDQNRTVLVIEIGYFGDEPCIWMPINTITSGNSACAKHRFNITSVPQTEIVQQSVYRYAIGAVVGGSSAVNGMVFDRGAKADYDAWEELGNPGWGWDGLFPYFKKSVNFTAPSEEDAVEIGYTWNQSAWGHGPVQASYPSWAWETQKTSWDAWEDMDIPLPQEHALGDAVGRFWVPSSEHPTNRTRSYARYAYYDPIASRPNYHLLVGHKAGKLALSSTNEAEGVVFYQRDNPSEKITVKAKKEVVLAAGAVHSPQILQLSGIGPKAVLEAANIEVKVDAPGVGNNFQDHPQVYLICNYTTDVWPNPGTLANNATYLAEAQAQYSTNKSGPLTQALNSAFVFLPLNTIHSSPSTFHSKLAAQSDDAFLAPNLPPTVLAGYAAQKALLAKLYASPNASVYESPFGGACTRGLILQKPLSRGHIHINASDPYGEPAVDFRAYTNPLDLEQGIEFLKYTRRYLRNPKFGYLSPVETAPGPNVTDADTAGLLAYVRLTAGPTSFHASGTTAMMARRLGGVVGSDLRVYGVGKVSVVDAGIMPLIPGTHLSATVYAVAEKAADIIKGRA
ncbi:choline dehydrogenase [Bimuria novae-zelandiae CBS 107.79]|uniref:Choline dehydrogenase n=1 Tax=Bimuria novae-zelandiae CBS 107.79 TaxID=1447943 RepID=A0A6A5V4W2_9PLEO|nr:choline dehydrogenase [Bimuria novae-zelandiae CBS 107.79]